MASDHGQDRNLLSLRDRSPRRYNLENYQSLRTNVLVTNHDEHGSFTPLDVASPTSTSLSRRSSVPDLEGSESGTEADDEKPHLLKALPPARTQQHKGLKHSDGSVSPLLTPTQLDHQGYLLSRDYPEETRKSRLVAEEEQKHLEEERRKFAVRQRAERIRRLSEAALLGSIGIATVYGSNIWKLEWQWYLVEVLSQISAIAALVAFYPLRLVSVEADRDHIHIWSRFRIPPSFDPATVLYPTFVPILVSLSLVQSLPHLFLPNAILGLASLPPRLFPDWAKFSDVNTLHWMVSIAPLVTSRGLSWISRRFPAILHVLAPPTLSAELSMQHQLLLFPLHQALLPIIHELTTTSLLPTEKQLLSTALVNVLLFAESPQMTLLRSAIWGGGVPALILLGPVLKWNVALARVPSWRFKDFRRSSDPSPTASRILQELRTILGRLVGRADRRGGHDSESEDDMATSRNARRKRIPRLITTSTFHNEISEPMSANEESPRRVKAWQSGRRDSRLEGMKRRATIASPIMATCNTSIGNTTPPGKLRKRRVDWALRLTAFQATFRKRFYAAYSYTIVIVIVLFPVRLSIQYYATNGLEPIIWALQYFLSGALGAGKILTSSRYMILVSEVFSSTLASGSIPALRSSIGPQNARLVLVAYYALVLLIGLSLLFVLSPVIEVDTRRKIFHAIMVAMFIPTLFVDPCFDALALGIVLFLFLLLEVIRAGQVPPLGTAIGRFVAPYVDGRDLRGPMVVSHVFLLIGCAIPFWLSLASFDRSGEGMERGWDLRDNKREVAMVSGVVCVGMGDAAASLIGRRFGRRKWPWIGGKSLEGSAAFAIAVSVGLTFAKIWLRLGGWNDRHELGDDWGGYSIFWAKATLAGSGASLMEAVLTGANDNVLCPVVLWLLCRGLKM